MLWLLLVLILLAILLLPGLWVRQGLKKHSAPRMNA